jgi:hypothetical protein
MEKYKVICHIPGSYEENIIECRELSIRENCYTFWKGEYGESNELIASYPIQYTIIKKINRDE